MACIHFDNATRRLDQMAQAVSDGLNGWRIDDYDGDWFRVGGFLITPDGDLKFGDNMDAEFVESVMEHLDRAGFHSSDSDVAW